MINKAILVGNVGADPEVRYVKEDVPVAQFSLATSERYTNKEGQKVDQTEWHNIVVWRGLAKVVEQYVKKGSQLYIEGKITNRSYEKDGQTRYVTEILANEIKLLGRSQGGTGAGNNTNTQQATATVNEPQENFASDESDDLPF